MKSTLSQNEGKWTRTERLVRAPALIQRTSLFKSEKASLWRKAWLLRKLRSMCVSLLLGAEKPSNVSRAEATDLDYCQQDASVVLKEALCEDFVSTPVF